MLVRSGVRAPRPRGLPACGIKTLHQESGAVAVAERAEPPWLEKLRLVQEPRGGSSWGWAEPPEAAPRNVACVLIPAPGGVRL